MHCVCWPHTDHSTMATLADMTSMAVIRLLSNLLHHPQCLSVSPPGPLPAVVVIPATLPPENNCSFPVRAVCVPNSIQN
ncbi:hypothetical protein B0H17DRAFT_448198 [Mycena rosella]|uniref:Uncharacterized protein n=1 Tax=Mycena rosella TaxID=1033263 RepID=A0AAD7CD42_MYCRO|nr:hypothetical protein B0H17DRAFT_448198 [Mycena rosella]